MYQDLKISINGEMWQTSVRLKEVGDTPAEPYDRNYNDGREGKERSTNWINQRLHKREKCNLIVEFTNGNQIFRDIIKDLSMGGAFIETKQRFEPEQEIAVLIQTSGKTIERKGVVCRVMPGGIGVSFKNNK